MVGFLQLMGVASVSEREPMVRTPDWRVRVGMMEREPEVIRCCESELLVRVVRQCCESCE